MAKRKRIPSELSPKRLLKPKTILISPQLSAEQNMLQEMFGSGRSWGTGQNLPRMDGALRTGEGLINSGDIEEETASMFGLREHGKYR